MDTCRFLELRCSVVATVVLAACWSARADVHPSVEIKLPPDTPQAVAGQEYAGTFLVRVERAGTLSDIEFFGPQWTLVSIELPTMPLMLQPGVLEIPFRAIPDDADAKLGLKLRFNGRPVRKSYSIGPKLFARRGVRNQVIRLDRPPAPSTASAVDGDALGGDFSGPLQVKGRIVYQRSDAVWVGVDRIDVRIWDSDTVGHEEIWSGYTDPNGYFDTGVVNWEDSGDDPDLVLYFETDTVIVDVTDNSTYEDTYEFESDEVTDFSGSFYDFGTVTVAGNLMPAMHIFNAVVRTHRMVSVSTDMGGGGLDTPKVQVEWPDDATGTSGAWYEYYSDMSEIHMTADRQWQEGTVSHEYGHHFMHMFSFDPPDPDYCNDVPYCDYASGVPNCYDTALEQCAHCKWCPETDHDAWNEGWPNWLADTTLRAYPDLYKFDDGSPYMPLVPRDEENIGVCCQDGQWQDPFITEGFVGALLRDIDDDTQDDHDDDPDPNASSFDGILDTLCMGPWPMFDIQANYDPRTVSEFINVFLSLYPDLDDEFYPTAFNVAPAYVASYPPDTTPPSAVAYVSSPSHPLLTGGGLPCMTFQWLPADDDVRGACFYSYEVAPTAAGIEPDNTPDTVTTSGCYLQARSRESLGQWWFSIKAQGCPDASGTPGTWGPTATFGPFEVIDCNGSGYLDVCDIRCCDGGCTAGPPSCLTSVCPTGSCETSSDCNGNYVPDECDIASGTSDDCNNNGIPDECETVFHWDGTSGSWHATDNWLEGTAPTPNSEVCIDVPGSQTVTYSNAALAVGTLACSEDLDIASASYPWADLTLTKASRVDGDLTLSVDNTVLRVDDRLDIGGLFEWTGSTISYAAKLAGAGVTYANGGMQIVDIVRLDGHLVLDGNSTSITTTGQVYFLGASSVLEISPGSTYEHQGSGYTLRGWSGDTFDNDGTFIASVDTGTSLITVFTDNSGLIHVQDGTLSLHRGSSSTGDFLGDPGTTLEFLYGGHEFLPSSSIVADNVNFTRGNTVGGTYDVTTATTHAEHSLTFASGANIIGYGSAFSIASGTVNFDAIVGETITFDTLSVGGTGYGTANFNSGDPVQVTNLVIGPGTVQGPSTVTVSTLLTWGGSSGGALFKGPGVLNVNGDMTIAAGSTNSLNDRVLNNAGTATFLGQLSLSSSAVFNNLVGGVIDIQNDGDVFALDASSPLNNAGTLVKSAGVGTSIIPVGFYNSGIVEVRSGELEFYKYALTHQTQTAGQTVLNGGDLAFTNGAFYDIQGGLLTGDGTITGDVFNAGGTTAPGLSAGVIDIDGNYAQTTGATLEIEIAGPDHSVTYDVLAVTGTAALAGRLEVVLAGGFWPLNGQTFDIITGNPVSGPFDQEVVPSIFEITYGPQAVTLTAICGPGDMDCDGDVDLDDYTYFHECFAGPGVLPSPTPPATANECLSAFDSDGDSDVDLVDFAAFVEQFSR